MKTLKKTCFILAAIAVMTVISAKTFASFNAYLYIEDAKGQVTKVSVNNDGSFKTPALAQGTYLVKFGIGRGISSPTGGTKDRESSAPSVSEITVTCNIQSPRDASSGMASGNRMHKPITITKQIDKTTPSLASGPGDDMPKESITFSFGKIIIDINNNGITGAVGMKSKEGKTVAIDDWHQ